MKHLFAFITTLLLCGSSYLAQAQEPVKVAGQPGYNQPNQYIGIPTVLLADNMEPVIVHSDQDTEVKNKLAELEKKYKKKPNIIVFVVDDVGWMDFGFNGGGIAVGNPTPNIDRVASQGLILTSAYSQPTCSPTRATIMTGQLPLHHGILSPPMYGQPGGLEGAVTLPQLLSAQGYTTQAIGKWHIGENEGSQPQNVGFDDFRGFLSVSDMYTEWKDPAYNPEIALSPDRAKYIQTIPFNKGDVHCVKDGKIEMIKEITPQNIANLDQEWCAYGETFIKKQAGANKPFFLYYNTRGCHFDNYPNEYYQGRSPARTTYSDCIVELDDIFQRIYASLEASGQLENTIIIFTSDNGPEQEVAPYGRTPFRSGKGSTWEGGTRVPTFVYWKGVIAPRKSEGLFDLADIFNTSLALAGKPGKSASTLVPANRYIDGIDQSSFLLGTNSQSNRKSIIYTLNDQLSAVRIDEFKFFTTAQLPNATSKGQAGGLTGTYAKTAGLVFNLYTNPQEDESVALRHIPISMPLLIELERYRAVMKKYPGKIQVKLE